MSKQQTSMNSQKLLLVNKPQETLNIIFRQGILPLYFHANPEVSVDVLKALYDAGIRAVEYTNRGKEALQNFKVLLAVRDAEFREMHLGIGTIKNKADARAFINAGADFIISPGLVPEVTREADKAQILWIPGCMTVSEIIAAESLGAKLIKIFPGNLLGTSYMHTIKDIFPEVYFMPTGGVDISIESIRSWFLSGVSAVGMGSRLISKDLLDQKNYVGIKELTKEVLSIIQWTKV